MLVVGPLTDNLLSSLLCFVLLCLFDMWLYKVWLYCVKEVCVFDDRASAPALVSMFISLPPNFCKVI